MRAEIFDTRNPQVQIAMTLKLQNIQRTELSTLTYGNLEDFLMASLWKKGVPKSLHEAADEILSISARDIVRFLSAKAIIDGSKENLEDFADLIGGD